MNPGLLDNSTSFSFGDNVSLYADVWNESYHIQDDALVVGKVSGETFNFTYDNNTQKYKTKWTASSIGDIEIIKPLREVCYVHAKSLISTGKGIKKFNVQIIDEEGRVLIKIKDFTVRVFIKKMEDHEVMELFKELEIGKLKGSEVKRIFGV